MQRPRETPSPQMFCFVLQHCWVVMTFESKPNRRSRQSRAHLAQYASGFGRMLAAVDFAIGPSAEIALVGGTGEFLSAYRKQYLPRTVIAAGESDIALLPRSKGDRRQTDCLRLRKPRLQAAGDGRQRVRKIAGIW